VCLDGSKENLTLRRGICSILLVLVLVSCMYINLIERDIRLLPYKCSKISLKLCHLPLAFQYRITTGRATILSLSSNTRLLYTDDHLSPVSPDFLYELLSDRNLDSMEILSVIPKSEDSEYKAEDQTSYVLNLSRKPRGNDLYPSKFTPRPALISSNAVTSANLSI